MGLINKLINIAFPERADHLVVRNLTREKLLTQYSPTKYEDFAALTSFSDTYIRACVHEAKFHHNEQAWELLATLLKQYFKTLEGEYLVLPVPLSNKRQKERGYNQVTKVTKIALKNFPNLELKENILYRKRDTTPQTKLEKSERLKNVEDAFGVLDAKSTNIAETKIILIDDVATTGATLKTAKAALLPHKPKSITCLALAH